MEIVDTFCGPVADTVGLPLVTFKFILSLFLAFPLAFVHKRLPSTKARHVFSIISGILLFVFVYGILSISHILVTSIVTLALIKYTPTQKSPVIVMLWCYTYLSCMHIYRMIVSPYVYEMDTTAPQMIITIKLTSLAWNIRDGQYEDKDLRPSLRSMKMVRNPEQLEFWSYIFYFGGLLGGPAFQIREYIEFTDMTMFRNCKDGVPPSTLLPTLSRFVQSLVCMGVHLSFSNIFPTEVLYTSEFSNFNFFYKWVYCVLAIVGVRMQYYFAWTLAESANILNGFGFNGFDETVDKNPKFDRLANVKIFGVEFSQNCRGVSTYWNMASGNWLKNHVYFRLLDAGYTGLGPVFATNFMSAFWHGFYPGYYIHFTTAAFAVQVARGMRKTLRPFVVENSDSRTEEEVVPNKVLKAVYDIIGILIIQCLLGFGMTCFIGLSWEKSITFLHSMDYAGFYGMVVLYIFVKVVAILKPKKQKAKPE
eukprot:TRINITY_DN5212_c0_g1_i1.p1 TRINITY_DN5212_c0_g1~~TRINITY_DN5212_c0_g1_i1.p1  ORF type:complete len:478 (-),score=70.76 TRINITY_DN5212_c0_g1_i1:44-1477(-)